MGEKFESPFDLKNKEIKGVKVEDCEDYQDVIEKISTEHGTEESVMTSMPFTEHTKHDIRNFLENRLEESEVEDFLDAISD